MYLQDDVDRCHVEVPREDWIRVILGRTVMEWAHQLQDLKNQVDLHRYMAASSESQCFDPFVTIVNKVLQDCRKYIPDLPPFPVDDLRFHEHETVFTTIYSDGSSYSSRKPVVVAFRRNRLNGASKDAAQTSESDWHWSDALLAVEFNVSEDTVSLGFSRLSCLRSAPLTRALSFTVWSQFFN